MISIQSCEAVHLDLQYYKQTNKKHHTQNTTKHKRTPRLILVNKPALQVWAFKLQIPRHLTCYTILLGENYWCLGTLLAQEWTAGPVPNSWRTCLSLGTPTRCLLLLPHCQQLTATLAPSTKEMLKKHIKPSYKWTKMKSLPFFAYNWFNLSVSHCE